MRAFELDILHRNTISYSTGSVAYLHALYSAFKIQISSQSLQHSIFCVDNHFHTLSQPTIPPTPLLSLNTTPRPAHHLTAQL